MKLRDAIRQSRRLGRAHMNLGSFKQKSDSLVDNPNSLVSLLFAYSDSFVKPLQIEGELASLLADVRKLNPRTVLEIGTAQGGTLYCWTRLARPDAVIVSIDLPGGMFGGGYSRFRQTLFNRFPKPGQTLHLLREDSHAPATFQKAKQCFGGIPVDLLFIDGDHTYDGVAKDWEMYSQLVRPGGMIAFHDVASNYGDTQVKRLWDSIKSGYEHREYCEDSAGLYGIGVLIK